MTGSASALGSEYDAFLYAPIYRDEHEMTLSVVSVMARLDVDPWREAARLAGLPKEAATTRLASLLSRIPGGFPGHLDVGTIASRLIGLLPSIVPKLPLAVPKLGVGAMSHPRTLLFVLLTMAILGIQYVAASRSGGPSTVDAPSSTQE
jgi:hypothetical protein